MKSHLALAGATTVCLAVLVLAVTGTAPHAAPEGRRIALTFDDLPVHGPLPPGMTRVEVARKILDTLTRHRVPEAYGFVNAKALDEDPANAEVLRLWRAAGFPLGNHTWSHIDLHANDVAVFERDIVGNEPVLRTFMGEHDWRWFRFPFLREGDTPEKYDAVRALLARRGYRVAQVTVSFDDYAYNDPYARCAAINDREALAWLERSYLDRAAASLGRSREAARRVFGRDISHVMLLHIGAFQTVMLPRLLDLLHKEGFTIVSLQDAQSDTAYAMPPSRPGPRNGTFLDQVESTPAPVPDEWNAVFAQLAGLCSGTGG